MARYKQYIFTVKNIRQKHIIPFKSALSLVNGITQIDVNIQTGAVTMMASMNPERFVEEMCAIYYLHIN